VFDLGSEVVKKYDQDACECDLSISLGCRPSASGFVPESRATRKEPTRAGDLSESKQQMGWIRTPRGD